MTKLLIYILFVPTSMLAAGLFGMVHDQISYTISSEYFTLFKFRQFGLLNPAVPERIRAAQVGFLASWWMGSGLGVLCSAASFIQPTAALMARGLSWSLLIVVGFTLAAAFVGLGYGWKQTQTVELASYRGWFIPKGLENVRAFLCVGYMHNATYLGAALSIPLSWVFQVFFRLHTGDVHTY